MWRRKACFPWTCIGVATTCFLVWSLLGKVSAGKAVTYNLSGWRPPWGIQIRIDYVGLLMACLITGVGLMLLIYSWRYIEHELKEERIPYYYTLYLLIFTAMLGFTVTGDLFNFFVFMEIFSITSYALVAITGERMALRAAFKYLLMGAISSLTVLLAIAFLYSVTGSLNMLDISTRLKSTTYLPVAGVALVLFIAGFAVKSALFPVHVWLPDAHSIAPSPISALLSALVIKMGVLGIFRILFTVYGHSFSGLSSNWNSISGVIAWAAALSIILGSVMAIIQRDLKVMIAYSSVSQIGYILLGITLVSTRGMAGGLYNILAHAMGKACFFLVAGAFIYKHGLRRIEDLRGIGRTMPVTAGAFALAALSIVGLPPSAGFVAKWYTLWGCFQKGQYTFVVIVLLGSLLSAVYCFRVVYYMYFPGARKSGVGLDEAPVTMFAPAAVLAAGTLFFGIFAGLLMPSLNNATRVLLMK
ncbi:MAG: monovalent cation/H+ antiporter subunit D family protein [Actinobacteria bacterium]|nr:monovalent cation/H+ antiporter subunit D family protein [Actinomycetota bacterium]